MKYCEEIILSHSIFQKYVTELEYINDIFKAEGYKKNIFYEERALNLDKVEIKGNKAIMSPTMDMAIGISEGKDRKILMVELKFKVKNLAKIEASDINKKTQHSKEILGHEIPIHTEKIVLLNDNKKEQALHYSDQLRKSSSKILVQTAEQFKEEFF
jgi:hypothetical protein